MPDIAHPITISDTVIDEWHERDRHYLILYEKDADGGFGDVIFEAWDGEYAQLVEDGFIDPRKPHESLFEYAEQMGFLDPKNRIAVRSEPEQTGWVIVHEERGVLLTWRNGEMIWSGAASEHDLDRGAVIFSDEETAEDFFTEDEDEEFLKELSFHEVKIDVTPDGHVRPRRASMEAVAQVRDVAVGSHAAP